ncbi:MAG: ATP-dependent Clp protease proteolytic subunit [Verrucomicrobiota bacterium]|jgi:ATP-dependent Clp protease protease subunit
MNLSSTFRLLALAALVSAPVLAQQTTRRVVVPANAAPAGAPAVPVTGAAPAAPAPTGLPTAQPGATTVAPGPGINREEISPEQKAAMKEADRMRTEKARIDAEVALAEAKRTEELAPLNAETSKLSAERALRLAKASAEAAALEDERAKLERQAALEAARSTARLSERNNKIRELEAEAKQLQLEAANTISRLSNELARFQKEEEARKVATKAKPKYLKEPLVDGTLVISDRRIAFNGAVTEGLADYVSQRINFYNNQSSEFPIFIVVDNSPGGSVAAGYQIQKAMAASKAPVYVVVKGFAASMTAVIATLAERSYCYPNTIILHHQVSNSARGNMTVLKEQVEFTNRWFERLGTPVAKKMGLTLPEFVKQMYANDSSGDWQAFGEKAKELKWVDNIVERIEETAILDLLPPAPTVVAMPTPRTAQADAAGVVQKTDDKGHTYFELPALSNPFDAWWIYDPRGQYRSR